MDIRSLTREQRGKVLPLWCDFLLSQRQRRHDWQVEFEILSEWEGSDEHLPDEGAQLSIEDVADFVTLDGHDILVPLPRKHLRTFSFELIGVSEDASKLTMLLRPGAGSRESTQPAFLAICVLIEGEPFYVTRIFHETIVEHDLLKAIADVA